MNDENVPVIFMVIAVVLFFGFTAYLATQGVDLIKIFGDVVLENPFMFDY